MGEKNTLEFDWQFGQEEVSLRVASYMNNGSLYIGMFNRTEYGLEAFGDVTVNLPANDMIPLKANEAYINGDMTESLLAFIQKNKLGTVLPEVGYSGYGQYAKVAFDMELLKKFDPAGVERHLQQYCKNNKETREAHRTEDSHKRNRTGR